MSKMGYFYERNASYELLFADRDLGIVTFLDADFPNFSGIFVPLRHDETNDPILKHVWAYYDFSIEGDRIEQTQGEQEWGTFTTEHESEFFDLIDSDEWWLRKSDGTESLIMIPMFFLNGNIGWR
jgi:hypothetical protein